MSICRAIIIDPASETLGKKALQRFIEADQYLMFGRYYDPDSIRSAIVFADQYGDFHELDFNKAAALVAERGGVNLPLSAFRDASTFRAWPSNYATVEVK